MNIIITTDLDSIDWDNIEYPVSVMISKSMTIIYDKNPKDKILEQKEINNNENI